MTITVQQSAYEGTLQSPKTKTAIRHFPVSRELLAHIREYLNTEWRANEEGLLFSTRNGAPLNNHYVVKSILRPLTDRLGLPPAGLHALRHGHATELQRQGASPAIIQEHLGHAVHHLDAVPASGQ